MSRITCGPDTEVIGQIMLLYIDNLQAAHIFLLLEKYNLTDIQPDKWYRLKPWLDVINELSTQPGFTSNMVAVGLKVAEHAIASPEMAGVTLGQMLEAWNTQFHAIHRHGEIGCVVTEKVHDKYYRTIHRHIYPDDLNYGLGYGFAHVCLPPGTNFTVWYENDDQRLDKGGEETVICVSWD